MPRVAAPATSFLCTPCMALIHMHSVEITRIQVTREGHPRPHTHSHTHSLGMSHGAQAVSDNGQLFLEGAASVLVVKVGVMRGDPTCRQEKQIGRLIICRWIGWCVGWSGQSTAQEIWGF